MEMDTTVCLIMDMRLLMPPCVACTAGSRCVERLAQVIGWLSCLRMLVMFAGVGGAGVLAKVCVAVVVLVCVLVMVLSMLLAWIGVGGWCVLCCARGLPTAQLMAHPPSRALP